jgi:hypothetical protein
MEAGKNKLSAPLPREPSLLEGQQKRYRKLSAPLGVTTDFATCHKPFVFFGLMAGTTGLEPATSAVTVTLTDCI